jgi:hypothetical protein
VSPPRGLAGQPTHAWASLARCTHACRPPPPPPPPDCWIPARRRSSRSLGDAYDKVKACASCAGMNGDPYSLVDFKPTSTGAWFGDVDSCADWSQQARCFNHDLLLRRPERAPSQNTNNHPPAAAAGPSGKPSCTYTASYFCCLDLTAAAAPAAPAPPVKAGAGSAPAATTSAAAADADADALADDGANAAPVAPPAKTGGAAPAKQQAPAVKTGTTSIGLGTMLGGGTVVGSGGGAPGRGGVMNSMVGAVTNPIGSGANLATGMAGLATGGLVGGGGGSGGGIGVGGVPFVGRRRLAGREGAGA